MSAGTFKVGDVCVGQNFIYDTCRNAMECTIVAGLEMRACFHAVVGANRRYCYLVEWEDGVVATVGPMNLRRKEPPKPAREIDTVVSWSDCAWSPERVPA
jgi:hypothetical protein